MILNATTADLKSVRQSAIDEYFGPWAVESSRFESIVSRFSNFDLRSHVLDPKAAGFKMYGPGDTSSSDRSPYFITSEGVAIVDVCGPMMKYRASMSDNCSTVFARRQISHALENPQVVAILFVFDTPGGTVSGTQDLAGAIAKAAAQKPVSAFVEDFCASAGYWAASQCPRIYVNQPTAMIGSIGTFTYLVDYSEAAGKAGVKVHVVKAGEFKGDGIPGAPISDETIADTQRLITSLNDQFIGGVATGRGVSESTVREWADGRVHTAQVALELGLIEGISPVEDVLAELVTLAEDSSDMKINSSTKGPAASATPATQPKAEETPVDSTTSEDCPAPAEDAPADEDEDPAPADDAPTPAEDSPADKDPAPAATSADPARAELGRYMTAFGAANGAKWYQAGKSFDEASAAHIKTLEATIASKDKEIVAAKAAESEPVSGNDGTGTARKGSGMASSIRISETK